MSLLNKSTQKTLKEASNAIYQYPSFLIVAGKCHNSFPPK